MKKIVLITALLASVSASANWKYNENIDAMSDEDRSYIHPPEIDDGTVLFMKCLRDGLNLVILHGYMTGDEDEQVFVQIRVDKDKPYERFWDLNEQKKGSFAPMNDVPSLVAALKKGAKVVVRVTDADLDNKTWTHTLTGFSNAYSQLNCK